MLYTDIFRGVPVILVIYLIGFGMPGLGLPRPWNSPYIWGTVALVLTYAAYVAEVFRTGIEGIHQSQRAAAQSLGLVQRRHHALCDLAASDPQRGARKHEPFHSLAERRGAFVVHWPGRDFSPSRGL